MDRDQALDDLKTIRQIMARTRQSLGGHGGWFLLIAGLMWLVGLAGNQFLSAVHAGRMWAVVNVCGMLAMIWAGIRLRKRSGVSTPLWKPIFIYWLVLMAFAALLVWLFGVREPNRIGLLALLIAALGYVQIGLVFQSWLVGVTGILIAVLAIGAFFLVPGYFSLAMAILGGGLLIASGVWMIRAGK